MAYVVYIIKNKTNDLYTGITGNANKRLDCHNFNLGAHYTKHKFKFNIVFKEEYETLKEARAREIQIKKWRRDKKEMLIKRYSEGLPTKK